MGSKNEDSILASIKTIGEDFENYGGDIVLAIAAIRELDCDRPAGYLGQRRAGREAHQGRRPREAPQALHGWNRNLGGRVGQELAR